MSKNKNKSKNENENENKLDDTTFEEKQIELDTSQKLKIRRTSIGTGGNGGSGGGEDGKSKREGSSKSKTDDGKRGGDLKLVKTLSWYEKNFNEEKAKSRKDAEMQTETKDQIYKSYYEYLQSNSKGIQVDESDKKTLSQMRFDLFKKNIHLKYDTNVPLFEIKKEISSLDEADNNRTFYEYLSYRNRKHLVQNRINRRNLRNRPPLWDDDVQLEDVDEEEFYRRHEKMSFRENQERFIWQIDEFNT